MVIWPAKAYDAESGEYVAPGDGGKELNSEGTLVLAGTAEAPIRRHIGLVFPNIPEASAVVQALEPENGAYLYNADGSITTEWALDNRVIDPVFTEGNSARAVLTLDAIYDATTFELTKAGGWEVESINGQEVTLVTAAPVLSNPNNSGWSLGKVEFVVNTLANLFQPGELVNGTIAEVLTVSYPEIGQLPAGEVTAESSASASFPASAATAARIEVDFPKTEIEENLSWTVYISAGDIAADQTWAQEIRLPQNGDITWMDEVAASNDQDIEIDPTTGLDNNGIYDGVGRSQFDGSYTLTTVTIEDANDTTTVTFYNKDAAGNRTDVVTREVDAAGVVDLSDVGDRKFFEVSSTGNISDQQQAGAIAHFTITPTGNIEANDYVAWLSPLDTPAGEPTMPWPDHAKVVASEISGTVWQDENDDTAIDTGEPRHGDVTVQLQRLQDDDTWQTVETQTTADDGSYLFDTLHSGEYRVVLPNVERGEGRTVTAINGAADGFDGTTLTAGVENRFGVFLSTEQTRSYLLTNGASSSSATVSLGVDQSITEVDFGYLVPNVDLMLDKSEARITSDSADSDFVTVEWDVDITNAGNIPIEGLTLSDRTSAEVQGLQAQISYLEDKTPTAIYGGVSGELIAQTENNFWVLNSNSWQYEVPPLQVGGLAGTPIAAVSNGLGVSGAPGTLLATSEGIWGLTEYMENDPNTVPIKLSDITGTPLLFANTALSPVIGAQLAVTTDGYWYIEYSDDSGEYSVRQIPGITGELISAVGTQSQIDADSNPDFSVLTSAGYWLISSASGSATQLTDITGTPIKMDSFGSGVITSSGFWSVDVGAGSATGHPEVTGTPIDVASNQYSDYYLVATSDGYWIGRSDDAALTALAGVTGTPVDLLITTDAGFIATLDGVFRMSYSSSSSVDNPTGWIVTELTEVTGTPLKLAGNEGLSSGNSLVATTDGYWWLTREDPNYVQQIPEIPGDFIEFQFNVSSDGTSGVLTDAGFWFFGEYVDGLYQARGFWEMVDGESLSESGSQLVESAYGRDWVRRTYELPLLYPGSQMSVTLSGTVARDAADVIVGNQAWVTSELTPRSGLAEVTDPTLQMDVTGDGMDPGVPDVPELPSVDDYKPSGIEGTNTVSLNEDSGKDNGQVDDLADQTPALIPNLPGAELTGSVGGTVWYDNSVANPTSDGLRAGSDTDTGDTTREPRVVGMTVTVRHPETGLILGQTVTDENGRWQIDRLPLGLTVDVQYDSFGWVHNDIVWTPVTAGAAPTTDATGSRVDSDADASGFVEGASRLVTTADPTAYGWADLGLKVVDADIHLVKGATDDYAAGETSTTNPVETDELRGDQPLSAELPDLNANLPLGEFDTQGRMFDGDDDPRTQAYGFTIDNPGQSALTNITVSDVTNTGNPAVFGNAIEVVRADGTVESAQLLDFLVVTTDTDPVPVVLASGDLLRGYFHVGFSTGAETHSNDLTTSALAVSADGTPVAELEDVDPFTSSYEEVLPMTLKLRKVSAVQDANGGYTTGLQYASFKVETTSLLALPESDDEAVVTGELGILTSDVDGYLDLPALDAGVYRVTETVAPDGYVLPTGVWYLQLSYGENGEPQISSSAFGDVPYVAAVASTVDGQWGEMYVTNTPSFTPPATGSSGALQVLWIGVLALLGAGAIKLTEFRNRADARRACNRVR